MRRTLPWTTVLLLPVFTSVQRLNQSTTICTAEATTSATTTTTTEFRRCRSSVTELSSSVTNSSSSSSSSRNDTVSQKNRTADPFLHHTTRRRRPLSLALHELYHSTCEECPETPMQSSSNESEAAATLTNLSNTTSNSNNKTRVVVLVTHSATLQQSLALAAGLLTLESRVAIVTTSSTTGGITHSSLNPFHIRRALFHHIPCANHAFASTLLTFHRVVTMEASSSSSRSGSSASPNDDEDKELTQSAGDVFLCSVQHARETVAALERELAFVESTTTTASVGPPPSGDTVFIMDASFVAGLLLAERHRIPTVLVVEHADTYLRPLLGAAPRSHTTGSTTTTWSFSQWSLSWWRSAWTGWHDRLDSLDLTSSFVALNRVRASMQLDRIRRMSDVWQASGTVLLVVSSDPRAALWQSALPLVPIWIDPLVPPCIPCLHDDTTGTTATTTTNRHDGSNSDGTNTVVVASAPVVVLVVAAAVDDSSSLHPSGRFRSRRLLQALELARTSIRELAAIESCGTAGNTDDNDRGSSRDEFCWKPLVDFHVVGPTTAWMPEHWVSPDYVHTEDTNFLDSLVRHQPVAIVSYCDTTNKEAGAAAGSLLALGGPPVLCIEASWSPREIAVRLLDLWRLNSSSRTTPASSWSPRFHDYDDDDHDGLKRVVSIIERVGLLQNQHHTSWTTGQDMNRQLTRDLQWQRNTTLHPDSDDIFSFFDSLSLPLAWIICGVTTVFLVCQDLSAVHKLRLRRSHKSILAPILCAISDELNLVLSLWSDWFHEHLGQWDDGSGTANDFTRSRGEAMEQPGHFKRKRHPTKKRH